MLYGGLTPLEHERVPQRLNQVHAVLARWKARAPANPPAILAGVLEAPEHALIESDAPHLAHLGRGQQELLPLAALGWAPGGAAYGALLACVPGADRPLDEAQIVALNERARRFPEERRLLAEARAWVARLPSFARVPEALDVLRTLEADPDPPVARAARETAAAVRQALGK